MTQLRTLFRNTSLLILATLAAACAAPAVTTAPAPASRASCSAASTGASAPSWWPPTTASGSPPATPTVAGAPDRELHGDEEQGRLLRVDLVSGVATVLAEDARYDVSGVMSHPDTKEIQMVSFTKARTENVVIDQDRSDDSKGIGAVGTPLCPGVVAESREPDEVDEQDRDDPSLLRRRRPADRAGAGQGHRADGAQPAGTAALGVGAAWPPDRPEPGCAAGQGGTRGPSRRDRRHDIRPRLKPLLPSEAA